MPNRVSGLSLRDDLQVRKETGKEAWYRNVATMDEWDHASDVIQSVRSDEQVLADNADAFATSIGTDLEVLPYVDDVRSICIDFWYPTYRTPKGYVSRDGVTIFKEWGSPIGEMQARRLLQSMRDLFGIREYADTRLQTTLGSPDGSVRVFAWSSLPNLGESQCRDLEMLTREYLLTLSSRISDAYSVKILGKDETICVPGVTSTLVLGLPM